MCGIAGWVGAGRRGGLMDAMLAALDHRGPDDRGAHVDGDAMLGMTRLAIIDLVTGRQPMTSDDGRAVIVFNGEIYNFRALRAELEAGGLRFRTRSDTEVILRAWEAHGPACVEHLRGMFAFALWDGGRRRLFLARDRLGKKPLYYWHRDGRFVFASEPKALLLHPDVARELDPAALHHYLAFGYTPAERSIFAGIAKLPPGHTATLADGRLELRRYWSLPVGPAVSSAPPRDEATARVRREVVEAVRLRLESDVPLGVFLSGGIDSSVIVAAMREATSGRIATFTVGFGASSPSHDERPWARLVARRFATDHHEEVLEPKLAELVPTLARHFDEPFADSSAIPTLIVAEATRRHVTVALSGIGGDETFVGYPRYAGVRLADAWARVPRWLRAAPERLARAFLPDSERSRNLGDWARRFVAGAAEPMPDRYINWTRFFGARELAGLATPALRAALGGNVDRRQRAAWAGYGHGDPMDGAFRVDLATYLPDDLLTMADRTSMAHSLELRAPFCDHRLVEASLALAPSLKAPRLRLKGLLKAAFADVLPSEILTRQKQGFMIPLNHWLRTDLRPLLDDLLEPGRVAARGLFEPAAVATLRAEHLGGRRTHGDRLWTLMLLELWLRELLDRGDLWRLR